MSIFKKVTPLELLQAKSENAVSLIRNTINKLKATNEAIAAEHEANDVKIANLQTINESLDVLKADNTKIITNFENLLS